MLCGELLNGGFVSAGAVPVVSYGLPGLWLPGCLRATSPRVLTSPYLTLLAELLAAGRLELRDDLLELMDLAKRSHQAPGNNGASELDLDLHADDIDEIFLGKSLKYTLLFITWFLTANVKKEINTIDDEFLRYFTHSFRYFFMTFRP